MTAPNMSPMIGTMSDERSLTERKNQKKTIVPMNEKTIAPVIRIMRLGAGTSK